MIHIFHLIEVSHGMGVESSKLRLSVHHHQDAAGRRTTHSTQFDAAASTIAHTEAKDVALRYKETRHLARDSHQELRLASSLVGARHHHLVDAMYLRGIGNACGSK